jgi:hypothetical protein
MEYSKSAFSGLIDMITDPKKAFAAADKYPKRFWTPLATTIVMSLIMIILVFISLDFDIMIQQTQAAAAAQGNEVPEEMLRSMMNPGVMIGMGSVMIIIMTFLLTAISATYLLIVSKVTTEDTRGFGSWFSFASWTLVPTIVAALVSIIYYLAVGNPQMGPEQVAFYSFNELFFHHPAGTPAASFWGAFSVFSLWTITLIAIGLQVWTNRTFINSLIIAVVPYVVFFGIWGFMVL